ncbi:MAG: hypothetical protein DMF40_07905 [Verrucomicrobia bacterium]|nr:MAG: hypothetical protein DMF40_07905 [Verrucomicrobiota bacterium]
MSGAGVRISINHQFIMSNTYVPLISSGVAGPLGVLHLPRMWQKVSLEASGKLAPGYPGIGRGFDAMTCAALGLEEQAVKDYIKQHKPTYPQFEAWIKKNAKSLTRRRSRNIMRQSAGMIMMTRRAKKSWAIAGCRMTRQRRRMR